MSNVRREDEPSGQTGAVYTPGSQGSLDPPAVVPIAQKVYLTMEEAMKFSGLSTDYLNGKVQSGQLRVLDDGEPKIRRSDLEHL